MFYYERITGYRPIGLIIHRRSEIATIIRCHLTRLFFAFVAKFLKTLAAQIHAM